MKHLELLERFLSPNPQAVTKSKEWQLSLLRSADEATLELAAIELVKLWPELETRARFLEDDQVLNFCWFGISLLLAQEKRQKEAKELLTLLRAALDEQLESL